MGFVMLGSECQIIDGIWINHLICICTERINSSPILPEPKCLLLFCDVRVLMPNYRWNMDKSLDMHLHSKINSSTILPKTKCLLHIAYTIFRSFFP